MMSVVALLLQTDSLAVIYVYNTVPELLHKTVFEKRESETEIEECVKNTLCTSY